MRVVYEINLEDMRNILAEKYEIDAAKIEFMGHGDLVFARIDVSETETPGEINIIKPRITQEEIQKMYDLSMKMFHSKKEEPAPEQKEPEPTDEDIQELKYKQITDEKLRLAIKNGLKVADICKEYCLTDKKYAQRLYARIAKFNEGFKEILDEKSRILIRRLKKAQEKHVENGITIYTCPVCEKKFNTEKYPDYAYKKQMFNQKHIFCGYDCMRKAEKLNP